MKSFRASLSFLWQQEINENNDKNKRVTVGTLLSGFPHSRQWYMDLMARLSLAKLVFADGGSSLSPDEVPFVLDEEHRLKVDLSSGWHWRRNNSKAGDAPAILLNTNITTAVTSIKAFDNTKNRIAW